MKKILAALLVVLAACQNHDLKVDPCFLATEQNLSNSITYSYNGRNQLVSYSTQGIFSSLIVYDDKGRIASEVDNQIIAITYGYDDRNRLTLWTETIAGYPASNTQTKFFYNSLDQDTLQQFYKYDPIANAFYLWRYARRDFANQKNYSKIRTFDFTNSLIYTQEFQWDAHPNPYLTNPFFLNSPPSTNNMTKYTFTINGGAPEVSEYVYSYNSKGFPIEKRDPSNNSVISSYTYTNCK